MVRGENYVHQQWTKQQGLPDNRVVAILQSRDGYVWLATESGLARFDGVRFATFNRTTAPVLANDNCTALAEDAAGRMWVGTPQGVWSPHGLPLTQFEPVPYSHSTSVTALLADRQATMWVGTGDGPVRWEGKNSRRFIRELPTSKIGTGAMTETSDGTVWASTAAGLYRLSPGMTEFVKAGPSEEDGRINAFAVCADLQQRVWALRSVPNNGSAQLSCYEQGRWRAFPEWTISNGGRGKFLFVDRAGRLWMAYAAGTLLRFSGGRFEQIPMPGSAAQGYALCMAEDNEGGLWIGTESQGVLRLKPEKIWTATAEDGLPHDNVWSIAEDRDGLIWLGTDRGLARFSDGRMIPHSAQGDLVNGTVRVVTGDKAGRLWLGTKNTLACLEGEQVRHFRFPGEWFNSKVNALWPGPGDALWVGTVRGLWKVDASDLPAPSSTETPFSIITNASRFAHSPPGMSPDVRAVVEDREGTVWCALSETGLARIRNGATNLITISNGLSSDMIWALHADKEGSIWIGTDRGLNRWRDGRIDVFSTREGLFADAINQVVEDDAGHLWIGSDHGIGRVRKSDVEAVASGRARKFHCTTYNEEDGLLTDETNGQRNHPSACKARDGRIWFPTPKGAAVFDPARLPDVTNSPPLAIEHVRANGLVVYENASAPAGPVLFSDPMFSAASNAPMSARGETRSGGLKLNIPPGGAHILEIQYTASTFTSADQVRFKYRLTGLDKTWVEAGSRRTASYGNLRPGRYQFQVIGVNKYGVWNEAGTSLTLQLQPHFHETGWFYALCMLAAGSLALGFYRWRLGYVRRIHRLERDTALAQDRSRIARDLHDGLGAQLTQLTLLAELSDRPEKGESGLEDRLRQLSRLARETALQLKEIIWTNHPGDETLDGLAARICQYAEQFLQPAGMRCRFHLQENLPPNRVSADARHHLFLAAKEALNNAAKHSAATELHITISVSEDVLRIVLADNGRGFDSARSNQHASPASTSHGLRNMRQRMESLGGNFTIVHPPGGGTEIRLEVPLQKLVVS